MVIDNPLSKYNWKLVVIRKKLGSTPPLGGTDISEGYALIFAYP